MKQAKATVAEAEKLLRWLQQQDDAPPYNRTIGGYLLMLENCADPAKDYIDWKPGTSPKEIFALQQRAEKAEADNAALRAENTQLKTEIRVDTPKMLELNREILEESNKLRADNAALRADKERLDWLFGEDGSGMEAPVAIWRGSMKQADGEFKPTVEIWRMDLDGAQSTERIASGPTLSEAIRAAMME